MRIAIIVEGRTEQAFKPALQEFLKPRLLGKMPKLDFVSQHGHLPQEQKLRRLVERLLNDSQRPANAVIALTDVYTGRSPPLFADAAVAKSQMRSWVRSEARFYPHAAQHDFEAWLLPYWDNILRIAGHAALSRAVPNRNPELVNHGKPPANVLKELFATSPRKGQYQKVLHSQRILRNQDLAIAASSCPELKSFLNTILTLCDGTVLP